MRINLDSAIQRILKNNAKCVGVQIPEGLKTKATEIIDEIQSKTQSEVILFVDPCFGACDLADYKAELLSCDLLIHIGHAKLMHSDLPIEYVEVRYDVDITNLQPEIEKKLKNKFKKVALATTVQYLDVLPQLEAILSRIGIEYVRIPRSARTAYDGQILGCNFGRVEAIEGKVDCIIFFGDGLFHPLGLSLNTKKTVIQIDPLTNTIKTIDDERDRYIRKRYGVISQAMDAKRFGILIGLKRGQLRLALAKQIAQRLKNADKVVYRLAADFISPDVIEGIDVDALVSTACPRVAIDDASMYKKPILTATEIDILLGKKHPSEYTFDVF